MSEKDELTPNPYHKPEAERNFKEGIEHFKGFMESFFGGSEEKPKPKMFNGASDELLAEHWRADGVIGLDTLKYAKRLVYDYIVENWEDNTNEWSYYTIEQFIADDVFCDSFEQVGLGWKMDLNAHVLNDNIYRLDYDGRKTIVLEVYERDSEKEKRIELWED